MVIFALGYFFSFAANALYGPLAPSALFAAGLGAGAVGTATALQSLMRAMAQPLWGRLADRTGLGQRLSAISFLCGAISLVALSFAKSELAVTAGYVVLGALGGSGVILLDGTMIGAVRGERTRFARVRVAGTIGYGLATIAVMALRDQELIGVAPATVFLPAALMFAIAAVIVGARTHPSEPHEHTQPTGGLASPAFLLLLAVSTLQWASHMAYTTFVAPLGEARHIRPLGIGVAILAGIAIEAIVLRTAHRFSGSARKWLAVVAFVASVRWALYPFASSAGAFIALSAMHGVSFGLFFPTVVAEASRLVGSRARHAAQSLIGSIAFGVGGACGTFIAGRAFERFGVDGAWWSMVPLSLAACALSLLSFRNDSRNQGSAAG